LGNHVEDVVVEVLFMGSAQSARPPVVRFSDRAQAEPRAGEALVFDWTGLAFCCAVAGEISLRPTTLQEAQRLSVNVPLWSGDGPLVFALGVLTRCWPGETSRSTAGAAWAFARSPPRCLPTCARRSGAKVATELETVGTTQLRALMLRSADM
jgi:hypothetical protein